MAAREYGILLSLLYMNFSSVHLGGKKSWLFLFLPCLYWEQNGKCQWDIQAIMGSEIRTFPKEGKKSGEASYSIWEIVSALYLTNILSNLDIWIQISESESLLFAIYQLNWNKSSDILLVDIQSTVVTAEKTFFLFTIVQLSKF